MQPLFQNQTTVGKAELLEWYRKEITVTAPGYRALNVILLALCLGVAVWCLYIRSLLGGVWFVAGAVMMFVLAVLVGVNLFFRPRLAVWWMLRRDKGRDYPSTLVTQFHPDEAVVLRLNRAAMEAGAAEDYLQKTAVLQAEFGRVVERAQTLDTTGVAGLEQLRDELAALSAQMDALAGPGGLVEGEQRLPNATVTGYMETENLYVLSYDGTAVLLRKDGFPPGSTADFRRYLYDLLAAAARESKDKLTKKALLKALADYFTQDEVQP